jgi:hypothetical protein
LKKYEITDGSGKVTGQKPVAEIEVKEGPNVLEPIELQ